MSKEFTISKETELRLECVGKTTLKLLKGEAEIFGVEMDEKKEYDVTRCQLAIFTWNGALVSVSGDYKLPYISSETQMIAILSLHGQLESKRREAKDKSIQGPRVMVVGQTDAGKSTLLRTLVSYSCRLGYCPTFVDLDIEQGDIATPGNMSATPLEMSSISIEQGYALTSPLSVFFGHTDPVMNPKLFSYKLNLLKDSLEKKLSKDEKARHSGIFIDTCAWTEEQNYPFLVEAIKVLNVDLVIVVGHERLHAQLQSSVNDEKVSFAKLPRSAGAVNRNADVRRDNKRNAIKKYFYGTDLNHLSPAGIAVDFDEIEIYRIGPIESKFEGLQSLGYDIVSAALLPVQIIPTPELLHSFLAVAFADNNESLLNSTAAGYVTVNKVF